MDSTKFGNIKHGVYSNLCLVGNLEVPNIFRTEGACCHAVMHFSTCLYHLWEPFSLLDFIASDFCYVWLYNEVFVKWSVLWSKVPLQFHMSDHGLVTVAWYSSKICLICNVGIEAVCMTVMSQVLWRHCGDWKISDDVFFMIWLPLALHVLTAWYRL
jgi:hypothetical protein